MESTQTTRKARVVLAYRGEPLSQKISQFIESLTYNDVASGASDSISLDLENIDGKWMNEWLPQRGDAIKADIVLYAWEKPGTKQTFKCGKFTIDDLTLKGRPLTMEIGAVSQPAEEGFTGRKRTKTWEKVTVKEIASEIAASAKIALFYEAGTINIGKIEQSKESDSSFLYSLCSKYGLAMKVFNDKLIIFDEVEYEAKDSVATLSERDFLSWSFNTTTAGTYTGARVAYTDPDDGKTISFITGKEGRLIDVSVSVESKYDAELQAKAKLRTENKKMNTMTATIIGNPNIVASSIVTVSDLGKLSGDYYVDSVSHSVGSGYTMSLKMHRVRELKSTVKSEKKVESQDYTVKSGDNLWTIAVAFYGKGNGPKYTQIYQANKDVIEAEARRRGMNNSDNGHWIFPGTVLKIPGL